MDISSAVSKGQRAGAMSEHTRILQTRYKQLLSHVGDLASTAALLYAQDLLSQQELEELGKVRLRSDKEAYLCSCLTGKGVSKLVDISQVLKTEQARHVGVEVGMGTVESERVRSGNGGVAPIKEEFRKAYDVGGHSQEDVAAQSVGGVSSGTGRKPVFSDKPHLVEDTYSVLFFTFLTQILHYFTSSSASSPRLDESTPTPPSWLHMDLLMENTRDYFSTRALKDLSPSEHNPVSIKLSFLLESFQQLYHAFRSFKSKNLSLHEKLLEAVKSKEKAELVLRQARSNRLQVGHPMLLKPNNPRVNPWGDQARELEAKLAEVEALKRSYVRSEQRCKQLVVVTQQWALECEDKVKLINLQEEEVKSLKEQVEQLDRRVTKYKKFWVEYRGGAGGGATTGGDEDGRATDLQFEELRNELAMRRELYDMVLKERDDAQKEVAGLFAELEALKDHNVQLVDRAANYQVQAKAKEPSVREMSSLLEQNRKLREELRQVATERNQLSDRVKTLECQVEKLRSGSMAGSPSSPFHGSDSSRQAPRHALGYHRNPKQQQPLPPFSSQAIPGSFLLQNYHQQMPEDDNYSLSSSDCDTGSFTSSTSTSTTGRQVHPGPTSGPTAQDPTSTKNPRSIHLQNGPQGSPELCQPSLLGSRDASATPYQDRIVSADLSSSSETSFEEGVDYTRAIRYPNHSKIHVAPLVDEDRVVLRPEAERLGVAGAGGKPLMKRMPSKESQDGGGYKAPDVAEQRSPVYFEGNCYSDQGFNPLGLMRSDRLCPVCNYVFHAFSEAEFEEHKNSCRGKAISI